LQTPNPALWNWKGAPGFKASDLNDLVVGKTYLLPLFKPVVATPGSYQATNKDPGSAAAGDGGTGSNSYYNIVQFVGVKITQLISHRTCTSNRPRFSTRRPSTTPRASSPPDHLDADYHVLSRRSSRASQ